MPLDLISSQLKQFKAKCKLDRKEAEDFCRESPLIRTKREVQQQLAESEKYRANILKNVTPFIGLSEEAIIIAAQSMEEIYLNQGDVIIEQDDIGDCFFVLEEGRVRVTRKVNARDVDEEPKELVQLGPNSFFGEISLLTADPRSATITVISENAKALKMTKFRFDELLATTNKLQAENRRLIGRDVLESVPLFKTLTAINKKKIVDAMLPMTYRPNSYICRQGTPGNSFHIMTEGTCKVTINDKNGEREVAKLRPGDFFGEVALIESTNRRTANVVSLDTVNCLTLSRSDFNRLLKSLKVKIMEHQAMRSSANNNANKKSDDSELQHVSSLSKKRRISGFNTHGQRDDNRILSLLKRFSAFTTQALWNSLYSRMYREMLLDPMKCTDYGTHALDTMHCNDTRYDAVRAIRTLAIGILELDPPRRSPADHSLIFGLMRQRNMLRDELCRGWPMHQFVVLCKRIKIARFKPFRTIFDVDSRGTTAFLILRGAVRIFSKSNTTAADASGGAKGSSKAYFEQDLFPGEVFGESALSGMHTRMTHARALTMVDLAVVDDQDFMTAQDKDSMHMGTEERQKFLMSVPMFKDWDSYKLMRLAHVLVQQEANKGAVMSTHGSSSRDLKFIVNGRVDLVTSLEHRHVITTLLKYDCIGESGVINRYMKASGNKVIEEFYCVAMTRVDVLVLPESSFTIFDLGSVNVIRSTFLAKADWRREREVQMKYERAKVRKYTRMMHKEANMFRDIPLEYQKLTDPSAAAATSSTGGGAISGGMSGKGGGHEKVLNSNTKTGFSADATDAAGSSSSSKNRQLRPDSAALRRLAPIVHDAAGPAATALASKLSHQHLQLQDPLLLNTAATTAATTTVSATKRNISGSNDRPSIPPGATKVDDLEDIPELFARELDCFLVSTTCRNEREKDIFAGYIAQNTRPKSARLRIACARASSDAGFVQQYHSEVQSVLAYHRMSSSSPNSRPATSSSAAPIPYAPAPYTPAPRSTITPADTQQQHAEMPLFARRGRFADSVDSFDDSPNRPRTTGAIAVRSATAAPEVTTLSGKYQPRMHLLGPRSRSARFRGLDTGDVDAAGAPLLPFESSNSILQRGVGKDGLINPTDPAEIILAYNINNNNNGSSNGYSSSPNHVRNHTASNSLVEDEEVMLQQRPDLHNYIPTEQQSTIEIDVTITEIPFAAANSEDQPQPQQQLDEKQLESLQQSQQQQEQSEQQLQDQQQTEEPQEVEEDEEEDEQEQGATSPTSISVISRNSASIASESKHANTNASASQQGALLPPLDVALPQEDVDAEAVAAAIATADAIESGSPSRRVSFVSRTPSAAQVSLRRNSSLTLMGSSRIPTPSSYCAVVSQVNNGDGNSMPESHVEMKLNQAIEKFIKKEKSSSNLY